MYAVFMYTRFVFRRTFGRSKMAHREGFFEFTSTDLPAAGSAAVLMSLPITAIAYAFVQQWWVVGFLLTGPVVTSAGMLWLNRHSIPAATQAGCTLATEYNSVKKLLPRRVRFRVLKALLAHDQALEGLYDAQREVRTAQEQVSAQVWSSPLLADELAARASELDAAISHRREAVLALAKQLREVVNQDVTSRREAAEAAKAVKAVSALTTSRKALNCARTSEVPTLELV